MPPSPLEGRVRSRAVDTTFPTTAQPAAGPASGGHRDRPAPLAAATPGDSQKTRPFPEPRWDAPTPTRYAVMPGSQSPTTQFSPDPPPFPDSRVRIRNGGLTISAGAFIT